MQRKKGKIIQSKFSFSIRSNSRITGEAAGAADASRAQV